MKAHGGGRYFQHFGLNDSSLAKKDAVLGTQPPSSKHAQAVQQQEKTDVLHQVF
jgi:hypothetical protein